MGNKFNPYLALNLLIYFAFSEDKAEKMSTWRIKSKGKIQLLLGFSSVSLNEEEIQEGMTRSGIALPRLS